MKTSNVLMMALWITPIVIQSIIVIVMLLRKLVATFPVFFTYSVFVPTREVLLLFVRNPSRLYFRTYWFGEAVVVARSFVMIYEVICPLIRPYPFLRPFRSQVVWFVPRQVA